MQTDITTDMLRPGDRLASLKLELTEEFNESIVQSVGADLSRYSGGGEHPGIVHPALLIVFSNLTRSPSFKLPANCAAIQTHDDVHLERLARPGDTVNISWQVVDTYTRRDRHYQVKETHVADAKGRTVLDPKDHEHVHGRGAPGRLLMTELTS